MKERRFHLAYSRDLSKHLDDTRTNFASLYDVRTRLAWMLPQICVAWVGTNKHPQAPIVDPVFDKVERTFGEFKKGFTKSKSSDYRPFYSLPFARRRT